MVKKNNKKNSDEKQIHEKLSEIYYKPENLWTGRKAIRKLYEKTGMSKKKIKSWLAKTGTMAGAYSTSENYRSSALSGNDSKSVASI